MKKVCFLVMCLLAIAACKKTPPAISSYSYSYIDNGSQFTGNSYIARYVLDSSTGVRTFQGEFFNGYPDDSNYVGLTFSSHGYIALDTFSNVGAINYFLGGINGYEYYEIQGTYGITKLDTVNQLISGTFWFRGVNTLQTILYQNVYNGVFTNLHYATQ